MRTCVLVDTHSPHKHISHHDVSEPEYNRGRTGFFFQKGAPVFTRRIIRLTYHNGKVLGFMRYAPGFSRRIMRTTYQNGKLVPNYPKFSRTQNKGNNKARWTRDRERSPHEISRRLVWLSLHHQRRGQTKMVRRPRNRKKHHQGRSLWRNGLNPP